MRKREERRAPGSSRPQSRSGAQRMRMPCTCEGCPRRMRKRGERRGLGSVPQRDQRSGGGLEGLRAAIVVWGPAEAGSILTLEPAGIHAAAIRTQWGAWDISLGRCELEP
jgi:hypothetical protein